MHRNSRGAPKLSAVRRIRRANQHMAAVNMHQEGEKKKKKKKLKGGKAIAPEENSHSS